VGGGRRPPRLHLEGGADPRRARVARLTPPNSHNLIRIDSCSPLPRTFRRSPEQAGAP
jgi:hypothetical protein